MDTETGMGFTDGSSPLGSEEEPVTVPVSPPPPGEESPALSREEAPVPAEEETGLDTGFFLDEDILDEDDPDGWDGFYSVESAYTVSDLYFQMVVSNRLLGIIAALLVVFAIWGLFRFFVRLVVDNITNYF